MREQIVKWEKSTVHISIRKLCAKGMIEFTKKEGKKIVQFPLSFFCRKLPSKEIRGFCKIFLSIS